MIINFLIFRCHCTCAAMQEVVEAKIMSTAVAKSSLHMHLARFCKQASRYLFTGIPPTNY